MDQSIIQNLSIIEYSAFKTEKLTPLGLIGEGANYNWNYQNADTQVIGEIIEQTTEMSLYDFANSVLFSKIGMTASWWKDAFDNYMPWCCIDATTRDFARFGLLYAREGKWEQETIISGKWVAESTALTTSITSSLPYGYGYFWWPSVSNEWFMALGSRSNNIYVHPPRSCCCKK